MLALPTFRHQSNWLRVVFGVVYVLSLATWYQARLFHGTACEFVHPNVS